MFLKLILAITVAVGICAKVEVIRAGCIAKNALKAKTASSGTKFD